MVVPAVIGSIVVVGVLTLLQSVYNLKAAQMNVKCSLMHKFMLYEFELGHNTAEPTKNIYCVKGDGTVDHSTVIRWFKNCAWVGWTSMIKQNQIGQKLRISRLCSKPWKQIWWEALGEYQVSSACSQSSVVPHLHDLFMTSTKKSGAAKLGIPLSNYCKTFDSA